MVDDRRWPIINWTGSLRVPFFIYIPHLQSFAVDRFYHYYSPCVPRTCQVRSRTEKEYTYRYVILIYVTYRLFHFNRLEFFSFFVVLEEKLEKLRVENNVGSLTELIKDLHVYPDFHGNTNALFL